MSRDLKAGTGQGCSGESRAEGAQPVYVGGGDARHGELGVPTERKEPDARAQTRSEDRGDGTAGVRRRWG